MTRPSPRAGVACALLGCMLWFFAPLVFQGRVLFERDVSTGWHAQAEAIVRAVGEGSLPLWDPYASFGEPVMEFAAQTFYPLTWLSLLIPAGAFYSTSVVLHHLFGGAGLYLFLRAQGLSRLSCATGAGLWMASGPWLSVANMLNLFSGSAWMPWVLLAADRARRLGSSAAAVAWGGSVALSLLPGAETVLLAGLCGGAWFLLKPEAPQRVARLSSLATQALVTALLLAAVQWVPLFALVRQTGRAELPHFVRTYWSLHPLALLQVPFPVFFQELPLRQATDLADLGTPLFYSVFAGAPALALAAAGAWSRWRRGGLFFAAAAGTSILFALGRHAAAYDVMLTLLPVLRTVRYPVKSMLLAALALAVLAAFGLEALRAGERAARRCCAAVLAGLWLGALVAVLVGRAPLEQLLSPRPDLTPEAALLALAFQLSLALAGSLLFLLALRRAALPALALAALAQPALAHHGLNAMAPEAVLRYRPRVLDAIKADGGTRVFSRTRARDTAMLVLRQLKTPPGISPQLATVLSYKQMLLPDVARVFGLSSSYEGDIRGVQSREMLRLSAPVLGSEDGPWVLKLLQLGAVTHAVTLDPRVPQGLQPLGVERTLMGNPVYLYRVTSPLPRCYVVGGVRVADGDAAIGALLSPGFDPRREVVLSQGAPRGAPPGEAGSCRVVRFRTARVEVETLASEPGYVVLVDTYAPGWRATVDGAPVPVQRANVAFRAVAVPAGRHSVVWSYAAPTLWIGLGLTLLGAAFACALVALERRRAPLAPG